MSPIATSTVRPGLLPSIVKGVVHVQFDFWNMIICAPSPAVSLTLGLAQVNLPVIFVCAPAMTAIPQSSAGTKMTFRMTTSGEGGGDYRTCARFPNSAHAVGRVSKTTVGFTDGLGAL